MDGTGTVLLAATAFVGSHFALSHPLRAQIVARTGEGAFMAIYSVVAVATLAWLAEAYRAAPPTAPLWEVGDGLWAVTTLVMLVAAILLMGSLIRNPAMAGQTGPAPTEAKGVFAVTRHPMMWAFALWGLSHILVYPVAANIVVAAAMVVLPWSGRRCRTARRRACGRTIGPPGSGARASCPSRRSRPAGRGSAGSARTPGSAAPSSGLRPPGPTCRSRAGPPASGAGSAEAPGTVAKPVSSR